MGMGRLIAVGMSGEWKRLFGQRVEVQQRSILVDVVVVQQGWHLWQRAPVGLLELGLKAQLLLERFESCISQSRYPRTSWPGEEHTLFGQFVKLACWPVGALSNISF